jgi:hypothetical protein
MDAKRAFVGVTSAVLMAHPLASSGQGPVLADFYSSGKIRLIEEIGITHAQLPQGVPFENPGGLAVDAAGNAYVSDFGACNIKVFGPEGAFLRMS